MRRLLILIMSGLCYTAASAQHEGYTPMAGTADFASQFAVASGKITSIQADFVQEKSLSMLSEKIVSRGKFWYKKENQVRMEYLRPFQYLLILSSTAVYIKDGDRENKISTKSSKLFRQVDQVIIDCVRGTALLNPDFKVRLYESPKGFLVELSPVEKNLSGLFRQINLLLDKKDYTATRIEMLEQSGDQTVITFANKQLNSQIPDALFAIH